MRGRREVMICSIMANWLDLQTLAPANSLKRVPIKVLVRLGLVRPFSNLNNPSTNSNSLHPSNGMYQLIGTCWTEEGPGR